MRTGNAEKSSVAIYPRKSDSSSPSLLSLSGRPFACCPHRANRWPIYQAEEELVRIITIIIILRCASSHRYTCPHVLGSLPLAIPMAGATTSTGTFFFSSFVTTALFHKYLTFSFLFLPIHINNLAIATNIQKLYGQGRLDPNNRVIPLSRYDSLLIVHTIWPHR